MESVVNAEEIEVLDELRRRVEELEGENCKLKREKYRLEEKLTAAFDGTGLCLWEQHIPSGKLTIFNMEWGNMLGFTASELEATVDVWKSKLHPEDKDDVVNAFMSHLAGESESYQAVHRMLHKDGSHSWVSDRGRVVEFDDQDKPLRMMGTHIDITQEKRYEQKLSKLATTDPLTNLLNRSALEKSFEQLTIQSDNQSAALLFIDLDNFKLVNDHLGHKAGDNVLIQVAEWMREDAPEHTEIARLGGDEFVLLCRRADKSQLEDFSRKLLKRAASPLLLESGEANIGFSIGIRVFDTGTSSFNTLYEQADTVMYQVKRQGKGSFSFY
ncbi:sensor domain-containing diguanylate cyclase [Aliivibrio kagoshimensis]|uniref:sensor domain-containing diguanylate cyclase n=1 Tax=Aliivibrio kagoshimensis TaxID=2910230 RepID=UPI003D0B38C3